MSVQWSRDFFLEFLEIYHKNDCLWRIKSKHYYNKTKKKQGYAELLEKARSLDPNYTEDDVKKKINNFRSSFRKEIKKVSSSFASGTGSNEVYAPRLWYYENLLFLKDQEEPVEGESEPENSEAELTEESSTSGKSSHSFKRQRTMSHEIENQDQLILMQSENELIVFGDGQSPSPIQYPDDFDIAGRNIASKLRQLQKDQYIIAEKLINDIIFEAQFNNLNKHAHVVVPLPALLPTTIPEDLIPSHNE